MIMQEIMLSRVGRSDARLDDFCEAYYELRRAYKRDKTGQSRIKNSL
ncbi:MAG: hypothetical protein OXC00_12300 [Acidimicrobiaceae bacterium]|nr:hypothetical protein [Acidimicrobiaceae bacterium]